VPEPLLMLMTMPEATTRQPRSQRAGW
jgi:hypothetical protein